MLGMEGVIFMLLIRPSLHYKSINDLCQQGFCGMFVHKINHRSQTICDLWTISGGNNLLKSLVCGVLSPLLLTFVSITYMSGGWRVVGPVLDGWMGSVPAIFIVMGNWNTERYSGAAPAQHNVIQILTQRDAANIQHSTPDTDPVWGIGHLNMVTRNSRTLCSLFLILGILGGWHRYMSPYCIACLLPYR